MDVITCVPTQTALTSVVVAWDISSIAMVKPAEVRFLTVPFLSCENAKR